MKLVSNIPDNPITKMPNTFIEASYSMPLSAMRLKMILFSKLETRHYLSDKPVKIKILGIEYMKYCGIDKKNIYKVMRNSAEQMLKTKVLFKGADDEVEILDKYDYLKGGDLILYLNERFLRRCLFPLDNPLAKYFGL